MARGWRILNVAEKPSVAKEISNILSQRNARFSQTCAPYNGLFQFQCAFNGATHQMSFTSVLGHLMELDFNSGYRPWRSCRPIDLFNAPVEKHVPQDKLSLKRNLETQARRHDWLILWLDCDREGENIAFEVMNVCLAANPRLVVKRARFSALTPQDLRHAVEHLVEPDELSSLAVDTRQEIDLRIGASFTRFQTLLLQDKFQWNDFAPQNGGMQLISYGPCQFPTLGLIVQRAWEIQAHQPEPYWYLHLKYQAPDGLSCEFTWSRGHIFDRAIAAVLYEACSDDPHTVVTEEETLGRILETDTYLHMEHMFYVSGRENLRHPPPPLSTLEMQKKATGSLRLSGERIMKLAEELYQTGFISYPRTETDSFDPSYDILGLVQQHTGDPRWGAHAQAIMQGSMWKPPGNGGHDDRAHPPIHPTKHSTGEANWCADKRRLYEFVVRSFLATCSKPAVGRETRIDVSRGGEAFHATGLVVVEQNWLAVYPYTRWGGNGNLPHVHRGQRLSPVHLTLQEAATAPPPRLSERDLIALMESHGIGTDATVAEHIQKQVERRYASKSEDLTFWPTPLGEGLVSGYQKMGLQGLWLPNLRGSIEQNITMVARRQRRKEEVLAEAVTHFRGEMQSALRQDGVLQGEMARFFQQAEGVGPAGQQGGGDILGRCHCGGNISLRVHARGGADVTCSGRPLCDFRIRLPRALTSVSVSQQLCPRCVHEPQYLLDLRIRRSALPAGTNPHQVACVVCDAAFKDLLQQVGRGNS